MMREFFWRIVVWLLSAAVLMGVYFMVKEIIYSNDLTTQERILYYMLFMAMLFGYAFMIERRR